MKTWTGSVPDPNSPTYNGGTLSAILSFTAGTTQYIWNTSTANQNWTATGSATTWAAGDSAIFTDATSGTTFLEVGTSMVPLSVEFAHSAASTGPGNYFFESTGDFVTAAGGNVSSSSPFSGTGESVTLDSGFLGKVTFHGQIPSGTTGGTININGGILELDNTQAVPGGTSTQKQVINLGGGELAINVVAGSNVTPGSSDLSGPVVVSADSILALTKNSLDQTGANTVTSSRTLQGSITFNTAGKTLSLLSTTGVILKLDADISGAAGTFRLIDPASPAPATVALFEGNAASKGLPLGTLDTGTGASIFQNGLGVGSTTIIAALVGGPNTTIRGSATASSPSTYSIGTLGLDSTFQGIVADNANGSTTSITKVGSATLNLTGASTMTGTLQASSGILALGGTNGSALTANYVATGGTLRLDNSFASNNNRLGDTTPVNLNQGSFEFIGNLGSQTNEVAGPLTISGATNVTTTDSGASGSATITFASLVRNNGIVNFNLATNTHVRLQTAPTLVGGIIGGFATTSGFQNWASLDGNNNAVIGFNNYNTDTNPNNWGTLANVQVSTGSIALSGSAVANSIKFATAGGGNGLNIPTGSSFTVSGGGILANTSTTISGGGTLTAGTGSPVELDLVVPDPTQTLTINSVIADNGAGGAVSLLKVGPGTLILGASNTFSGALAVAGGALSVNQANLLSPNGGLTVDLGTTFDLNGFSQNVASITLINGTIKNTPGGAAAMNVSGAINVQSGTISANLTGAAALTKTSGNTVTLTGSNSYTGGTTVSNGNLNVNSTTALTGNATFTGGTTNINANTTLGTVLGAGNATITGGTLTASSYEFTTGGTTVTAVLAGANVNVGVLKDADSNGSVTPNEAPTRSRARSPFRTLERSLRIISRLAEWPAAWARRHLAPSIWCWMAGIWSTPEQQLPRIGSSPSPATMERFWLIPLVPVDWSSQTRAQSREAEF